MGVPGGLILYCTALFCTVLYNKTRLKEGKMRKFAYKEQTHREQINVSTTESTLILSGSSGIWYMVYGIWYMVYGIWYMVYGTGRTWSWPVMSAPACSLFVCSLWAN